MTLTSIGEVTIPKKYLYLLINRSLSIDKITNKKEQMPRAGHPIKIAIKSFCFFNFFQLFFHYHIHQLCSGHCKPIPVMKTGFSLCTFSHREKPVSISWDPCNNYRFFPVGKKYTGKSLFWPCTDPVRDCSVINNY